MSYKNQVIKRMEGTRDCAIENAEDLYSDIHDEMYPNDINDFNPSISYVWFKALEDARKIQAVIDALKALDESWFPAIQDDFREVK